MLAINTFRRSTLCNFVTPYRSVNEISRCFGLSGPLAVSKEEHQKNAIRTTERNAHIPFYKRSNRRFVLRKRLLSWSYPYKLSEGKLFHIKASFHSVVCLLSTVLSISSDLVAYEIFKHPGRQYISPKVTKETVQNLLKIGFSKDTIAQTLAVCFYPWNSVQAGLNKINQSCDELNDLDLYDGILLKKPRSFLYGSSCDRRLELCLYYMELPLNFSGRGLLKL